MAQRLLFRIVAPVAARMPEWLLASLAMLAGVLAYLLAANPRAAVDRNLRIVQPELDSRARRRLVLATFIHGALGYVELFKLADVSKDRLQQLLPVTGWEHVERGLALGKGVVVVSAHLGNPSAAGQLFAIRGFPTSMVVEDLQPAELFERVTALRGRFGARMIPGDRSAVRAILTALRENGVVGIMADRDVKGSGDMMPFFGQPVRLSPAAATFALRSGATIVPAVTYRTAPFRGVLRIGPPIPVARSGDTAADVQETSQRILRVMERLIRTAPQQWAVFTDVWETPAAES
jgi:lauroyl/myristoyl acyltransferase